MRHTGVGASSKGKNSNLTFLFFLFSRSKNKNTITQGILQKYELNRKWYLLYGECGIGGEERERERERERSEEKGDPFFPERVKSYSSFFSLTLSLSRRKNSTHKTGSLLASAYVYIRPLIRRGIGSAGQE